jgi:hypothetical protein
VVDIQKYNSPDAAKKLMYFLKIIKHNPLILMYLVFFSDTDKKQGEKPSEIEAKKQYQERRSHHRRMFDAVIEKTP